MTDTPADDETRIANVEPMPTNVIAAIARVEKEIGGISKLTPEQHAARRGMRRPDDSGIKYSYRGIDQIAQAAQPLFGKYGVVIVPEVENHIVDDITVGGKPWTDTHVKVVWTLYGPGGVTDKITATTVGYGRDNSDKGMNKAMTGAYKNLLLRILSIGEPQDDSDHERHETGEREPAAYLSPEQAQQVVDFVVSLPDSLKDQAKNEIHERWGTTKEIPADDWVPEVRDFMVRYTEMATQEATTEPEPANDDIRETDVIEHTPTDPPEHVDVDEIIHGTPDDQAAMADKAAEKRQQLADDIATIQERTADNPTMTEAIDNALATEQMVSHDPDASGWGS